MSGSDFMNERLRAARAEKVRFTITSAVSDENQKMNDLLRGLRNRREERGSADGGQGEEPIVNKYTTVR